MQLTRASITMLLLFCLFLSATAHAEGPYWKGLPPGQPAWQHWSPSYPIPVTATAAYPETAQLTLQETTATTPAFLYSLHQVKPSQSSTDRGILLQKRDWKTGSLVASFGTSGTLRQTESGKKYLAKALHLGGDGYLYVLCYDDGAKTYLLQKRDPQTGGLVTGFGSDGIVSLGNIEYQKLLPLQGTGGLLVITKETASSLLSKTARYIGTLYAYSNGAKGIHYEITEETQSLVGILKDTYFADAFLFEGHLYTAINIRNYSVFPTGFDQKYRIVKTDVVSGLKRWEHTYTNTLFSKEQAMSLAVDNSGIYMAGSNTSGLFMLNVTENFVRKYDLMGSPVSTWGQTGEVNIPFFKMFFDTIENLTLRVTGNTLYLLNNGTSSYSFFFIPLTKSSAATLSRINKTTGMPDSSFADNGLAKIAKGKFSYFILDKWGSVGIIGSDASYTGDYMSKLGLTPIPYGPLVDSGIRHKTAAGIVGIAAEPPGLSSSPLRIRKNGQTYSLPLVEKNDPNAAGIMIETPLGTKSMTKFN